MEYKVIRSARKTLSISVSPENEVIIRCPKKFPDYKIEKFIEEKRRWIEAIIDQNEQKLAANRSITEYKQVYVQGVKLPLIICNKNAVTPSAVYVKSVNDIKKVFIKNYSQEFLRYVKALSEKYNLPVSDVSLRRYKSRWGCCDSKKNIKFNYILLMLPRELQRYVIIHELCHTVHFNHSKQFWVLVAQFEPDFRNLRNKLKCFDFIIKFY